MYWYTETLVEISNSKNDPSYWSFFPPSKQCLKVFNGAFLVKIVSEYLQKSFNTGISFLFHLCVFTCFMNST